MGFIPIVLVFVLAIMLWAILNYNSFVSKKSAAIALSESLKQLDNERSNKLNEIKNLLDIFSMNPPLILNQNRFKIEMGIDDLEFEKVKTDLKNEDQKGFERYETLLAELEANNETYYKTERKYLAAILDYNKQVKERPSSWVADIFGFKAM